MQHPALSQAAALVSAALSQHKLSGLSEVLRSISEAAGADGVILWLPEPVYDNTIGPAGGELVAAGAWFRAGGATGVYTTTAEGSAAGEAMQRGDAVVVDDVSREGHVYIHDNLRVGIGVKAMCSVPVPSDMKMWGAVDFYRTRPVGFCPDEVELLKELTALLPSLCLVIRDRLCLDLLRGVSALVHDAESKPSGLSSPKDEVMGLLQRICLAVSEALECVECTIFLEDDLEAPGVFRIMATTWHKSFKRLSYDTSGGAGLTGWVLAQARPLIVGDLARLGRNTDAVRHEYPALIWASPLDIETTARELLNLQPDVNLPPLCYMAMPIVKGDKVYGAIRCSLAKGYPYYFSKHDLGVLELVAVQIGQHWHNWLSRRVTQNENESWRALVSGISELNDFVIKELRKDNPNEQQIYAESLRVTARAMHGADVLDIRLLDKGDDSLRFAEIHMKSWDSSRGEELDRLRGTIFPLSGGEPPSAGARVLQTGKLCVIKDNMSLPVASEFVSDARQMLVAPIKIADEKFGVLDIQVTGEHELPQEAATMTELLGRQLGLYSRLATVMNERRAAEAKLNENVRALERLQRQQSRTFKDLAHQFKTPIIQAHAAVQLALSDRALDDRLQWRLRVIRGLCGKAKRVSFSTELFTSLASGRGISLKIPRPLTKSELAVTLIEAAADNRIIHEGRDINFEVDRGIFDAADRKFRPIKELDADKNLLDQAIADILDNAGKYSFSNTTVLIQGGRTHSGGLHITIMNRGIPVRAEEVRQCLEYGWQSEQARAVSDTGSGIGLWIVNHIMKAHDGELTILPTTRSGVTAVRLIFPKERVR